MRLPVYIVLPAIIFRGAGARGRFRPVLTRLQYQTYIFVTRVDEMHQCFSACVFKAFGRVLVSQLEQGQASTVCLFFYSVGSEQLVYHFFRGRTDVGSPMTEPFLIPFAVELVVGWHVIRVCAVLAFPAIQLQMRVFW